MGNLNDLLAQKQASIIRILVEDGPNYWLLYDKTLTLTACLDTYDN
jgi:hypothetical protein